MKLSIELDLSADEMTEVCKNGGIDPVALIKSLSLLATPPVSETKDTRIYSTENFKKWADKVSFKTFYVAQLLLVYAKKFKQIDSEGYYLESEQLEKLGISEKSASARVGGSRQVCDSLSSIDFLFIKKESFSKKKSYYLLKAAIDDFTRLLDEKSYEFNTKLKETGLIDSSYL